MGLPSFRSSAAQARRLPEILSAGGFFVGDETIPTKARPAKPSFFYRVSDGKFSATVVGEYEAEEAVTIVIPRFSLRFGRRSFIAAIRTTLVGAGFVDYPGSKKQ